MHNFKKKALITGGISGVVLNIRMLHEIISSIYSLSKGGLDFLTKALAFELGPKKILVSAITPGSVNTPLFIANTKNQTHNKNKISMNKIHTFTH